MLELKQIQGIVVSGYKNLCFAQFTFLEIKDVLGAKEWLANILPLVTTASGKPNDVALNIAFSRRGLECLGLSREIAGFPREFEEGMAELARSKQLGDTDESAPANWKIGGGNQKQMHVLLMIYGRTADDVRNTHSRLLASGAKKILDPLYCQFSERDNNFEPFGFRDGISQPAIEGTPAKVYPGQDVLKAGEFLLGYPNEYGYFPTTVRLPSTGKTAFLPEADRPDFRDFGRNGSYLVWRKLEQDVDDFNNYISTEAERLRREVDDPRITPEWVGAKMMGRWPKGAPVVLSPDRDDQELGRDACRNNRFDYASDDSQGLACPIGAHIRRTNPRDSLDTCAKGSHNLANRHRIMRRGRPYKDQDGSQGLLFLAINSDIGRQFEFIQQTWINNSQFNGLFNDKDAFTGDNDGKTGISIPYHPVRLRLRGIERFVTVRGGGYFFLPGMQALQFLSTDFGTITESARVTSTEVHPGEPSVPLAKYLWLKIQLRGAKAVEGGLTFPRATQFVFGLIRRYCPILKIPGAGVVVAKHADVMTVLSHDAEFKPVYLPKIVETTGAFAVGLHVADPLYKRQRELMHSAVRPEDPERIRRFIAATAEDLIHCSNTAGQIDAVAGLSRPGNARFVGDYFGVPGPDQATLDRWMHDIFRHIFANIANFRCIRDQAIASSKDMLAYVSALMLDRKEEIRAGTAEDNFLNRLLTQQAAGAAITDDEILCIVAGTFVGTVGISKAFGQAFDDLLNREVEMYKATVAARSGDIDLVSKYMFEALRFNPQNPILLRLCEAGFTFGKKRIDAGSTIWTGIMSAMFDPSGVEAPNIFRTDRPDREYAHFGHGPHECFGKIMALTIIPGMAAALLRTKNLRRAEGSRGKLVYDGAFPKNLVLKFDPL